MGEPCVCAHCQRQSRQPPPPSFGVAPLFADGRPGGPGWVDGSKAVVPALIYMPQACPWCGYCARALDGDVPAGASQLLGEPGYRLALQDEELPLLARIFAAVGRSAETGADAMAMWLAYVQAAWVCEDRWLQDHARGYRRDALRALDRLDPNVAWASALDPLQDPRPLAAIDLLRRSGQFERAGRLLGRVEDRGRADEPFPSARPCPLSEQRRLVASRDGARIASAGVVDRVPPPRSRDGLVVYALVAVPMLVTAVVAPHHGWLAAGGLAAAGTWVGARNGCAWGCALLSLTLPCGYLAWPHTGQDVRAVVSLVGGFAVAMVTAVLLLALRDNANAGPMFRWRRARAAAHLLRDGWSVRESAPFEPADWTPAGLEQSSRVRKDHS